MATPQIPPYKPKEVTTTSHKSNLAVVVAAQKTPWMLPKAMKEAGKK